MQNQTRNAQPQGSTQNGKPKNRGTKGYQASKTKNVFQKSLIQKDRAKDTLMGAARNATITEMKSVSDSLRKLYSELSGTTELWELQLLEHLFNPMHPYPLPCISQYSFAGGVATYPLDYDPLNPANTGAMAVNNIYPGGPLTAVGIAGLTTTYDPGNGTFLPVNGVATDAAQHSKYDERYGLCRGTFSVSGSGAFVLWFDAQDYVNPVKAIALTSTEASWTDTANFAAGVLPANIMEFSWDRDPYRGYVGDVQPVGFIGMTVDRASFVYIGGAVLHMAVQAMTAYSDVSIKSRNGHDYDRRFFDAPGINGEYGDPTQPVRATEGLAVYSGSCWSQRIGVTTADGDKAVAARFAYAIAQGLPMLEVHVVNANTGGAPVNFNFEARTWLGMAYSTLKDNATTSHNTIACTIPPWFTSCRTRGAISTKSTELASELIVNTQRNIAATVKPKAIAKVAEHVDPRKGGSFLKDIMEVVGIDPSNPFPSIAKKLLPIAGKFLSTIF